MLVAVTASGLRPAQGLSPPADKKQTLQSPCSGRSDDTVALEQWISSIAEGTIGVLPPGTCRFSRPLKTTASNFKIVGAGQYSTTLLYTGGPQAGDILTIGNGETSVRNIELADFRISSATKMGSGAAVHFRKLLRSAISNVIVDGQDGSGNFWDGIWFDEVDFVRWRGFEARAQSAAIKVNGGVGKAPKADLFLSEGKISTSGIGVHVGGGFGGLYIDACDIIKNKINLLVDTQLSNEGNREIFVGSTVSLDSAISGPAVVLNDDLAKSGSWLQFNGTWIASGPVQGMTISEQSRWTVSFSGGTIFNFKGDGISNMSSKARLLINGTVIRDNRGFGVSGVLNNSKISQTIFIMNGAGDVGP